MARHMPQGDCCRLVRLRYRAWWHDAPKFLAAAEPLFSAELRAKAGSYLYDGTEVDYAAWKAELLRFLGIIDLEEGSPPPS
jgi:hypothetical protein